MTQPDVIPPPLTTAALLERIEKLEAKVQKLRRRALPKSPGGSPRRGAARREADLSLRIRVLEMSATPAYLQLIAMPKPDVRAFLHDFAALRHDFEHRNSRAGLEEIGVRMGELRARLERAGARWSLSNRITHLEWLVNEHRIRSAESVEAWQRTEDIVALRREIAGLRRVLDERGRDAGNEDIVALVVAVEDRLDVIRG